MQAGQGRFRVALTTAGSSEQASSLARALVERRLAACVNLVGSTCSVYRWKGEIVEEGETLLVIKTRTELLPALEAAIAELHSYELPELLVLDVAEGSARYLDWLAGESGAAR